MYHSLHSKITALALKVDPLGSMIPSPTATLTQPCTWRIRHGAQSSSERPSISIEWDTSSYRVLDSRAGSSVLATFKYGAVDLEVKLERFLVLVQGLDAEGVLALRLPAPVPYYKPPAPRVKVGRTKPIFVGPPAPPKSVLRRKPTKAGTLLVKPSIIMRKRSSTPPT